jgi:hypothetical protein
MITIANLIALLLPIAFADSSNIKLEDITNPEYSWGQLKSISIVPYHWTKWGIKNKIDKRRETAFLDLGKYELESRGYIVTNINLANVSEIKDSTYGGDPVINIKNEKPDLILTTIEKYDTSFGNKLVIVGFDLRAGPPNYSRIVWEAAMRIEDKIGFSILDHNEQYIVKRIFNEHFDPGISNQNKSKSK